MRNVVVLSGLILLMLLVCLPAGPVWSATYYVSTDGTGDYKTDGTDDHVEINQALQDIHKKGGGTVHLKKGTYVIDNSIVIHADTILEGDGWSTVITVKDDGAQDWPRHKHMVINGKETSNIAIRNLKIDGKRDKFKKIKGSEGWGHSYQKGICLNRVSNMTLSGLWIGNNRCDQIRLGGCKNITIQDCTLENGGHDCIYFYGGKNAKVLNCRLAISCNCGIRIYSANHVVIRGCVIHPVLKPVGGRGGNGIQIQWNSGKMDDIRIEDNIIFGVPGRGVSTSPAEHGKTRRPSSPGRIVVRNNLIYHCGGGGIGYSDYDMLIENNTLFGNHSAGIRWRQYHSSMNAVRTLTVRNNIIAGNQGAGMSLVHAKNVRILSSCNNVWNNAGGNYVGNLEGNVKTERDISVDPLFANPSWRKPLPGDKHLLEVDLHLKSRAGRWDGKKWVKDDVTSPCIDAGDPSFAYSKEPDPNGGRINLGGYGNTEYASKSTGMARGTIAGKVTDKTTGKPVSGAKLSTGGYFGTTDAEGNYTVLDVPVGEYGLKITAIKYVEQVQKVKVSKDGKTVIDLGLVVEKVPPTVKNHLPAGKSPIGKIIVVTFSEPMNTGSAEKSLSITPSAVGKFRWIGDTMYFIPDKSLEYGTKYKITIEGAEDLAGNKLKNPHVWEFSTLGQAEHLVGEWQFEEGSGDTAKDSSGRDNHGALKGKPTRVEGKIGKALSLDGVDDLVEVPHSDSLVAREEITIEAWVKPDYRKKAEQRHTGIAGKAHGWNPGYLLGFYNISGGYRPWFIYTAVCEGKGKLKWVNFSREGKKFGSWVHLAATRDFHGNVKTYVDGEQISTIGTDPITEAIAGTGVERGAFRIGYYVSGRPFKGIIDEVRIYNRALSPAEIKADFGRTK